MALLRIYFPVPMPATFKGMDYFLTEEEEGNKKKSHITALSELILEAT